ncbi:MAG: aldolase/citrate lyase family protein [Defluviitaleaceae bacterium]|nr:aldolase/citrate lyase family protein [Defluviitaleaceae bacterium]
MNLKHKMRGGSKVAGCFLRIVRNPAGILAAKNAGLDYVTYDCEHSNYNFETLHDAFILANAVGIAGIVRVPCGSRDYVSRALDIGAAGIMVPLLNTKEDAEEFVRYAKYPPIGKRGFGGSGADTGYKRGAHAEVMREQNEKVLTIGQIETKVAVDNVDEIAAVPGLDVLLVGPNDLSIELGFPGDLLNPVQLEAIAKVAAACKKHGKYFGLHAKKDLLEKFAQDLTFVSSTTDTDLLTAGFTGIRELCDSL